MSLRALNAASPSAPRAEPTRLRLAGSVPPEPAASSGHRQNGMGDVVIPVEHGEIVALPRLWDFDLERVEGGEATLRTDTGLIAVVAFLADTAVVAGVSDERGIA
jgi:hypothetical protein